MVRPTLLKFLAKALQRCSGSLFFGLVWFFTSDAILQISQAMFYQMLA